MFKKDEEIVTGTLTEVESGESWGVEFKPFFTDVVLMAIVKVEKIEIYTNKDDPESSQIYVECKALDSLGFIYNLSLMFLPETDAERDRIIADIKTDGIFIVQGKYSINQSNMIINIHDPKYLPLPPTMDEKEVREVFRVNVKPLSEMQ
jgi:hypothetical protein